ncbi:GILT-like protein 2 [Vanessa cardui]|uniref:GILT-like protein 2 n=1 Tax=Vanessa cardui TaxID=171605 RepID=UPI001F12B692|nr:GILT-like protein 2 [Vanessa cardui]
MALLNYISFTLFILFTSTSAQYQIVELSNALDETNDTVDLSKNDLYLLNDKYAYYQDDKVDVKLYYECLCPDCIQFDKNKFSPVVQNLSQYLNIHLYPYGNAQTFGHNGRYDFKCQHGPAECYGNKLHACAIDYLQNITEAVEFNACMMEYKSNDEAADRCANAMYLDSRPIKACAKGERGTQLLKYYGEESKKANFSYVPYILINGKLNSGDNFMEDICAEFAVAPPPCVELYNSSEYYH